MSLGLYVRISYAISERTSPHTHTTYGMREAEVYRIAFEREMELTDRALKLAEVGKPKSNWELQGLLGLAAFAFGLLAGR